MASTASCIFVILHAKFENELGLRALTKVSQEMVFQREWDASCPREWARWEADGKTWVVQDLRPEDDEAAVQMMLDLWVPDEPISSSCGLINDPVSLECFKRWWTQVLAQRMSLGCYIENEGQKTLIGLNVCHVTEKGLIPKESVKPDLKIEGRAAINIFGVLKYLLLNNDQFEHLGIDKTLNGVSMVVAREYRGSKLGGRILAAREPLCKSQGVKGSSNMFTALASQKTAANLGFTTISEATWSELADSGLDYPREDKVVKYMVKKYE